MSLLKAPCQGVPVEQVRPCPHRAALRERDLDGAGTAGRPAESRGPKDHIYTYRYRF